MSDSSQVYMNTKGREASSYDAIVIGSGISGGWAVRLRQFYTRYLPQGQLIMR